MEKMANAEAASGLTRAEVARILGVSNTSVRRREGKTLHPKRGPRGECLFDADEVEALCRETDKQPEPDEAQPEQVDDSEASASVEAQAHLSVKATVEGAAPPPAQDSEVAAMIFADLNAGKELRTIVVDHKLEPEVVQRWHQQWLALAQIDGLKTPAAERRILKLERALEISESVVDSLHQELGLLRRRFVALVRKLGLQSAIADVD